MIPWLEEYPGVDIITRDRSKQYTEGITQDAPAAIQVADRFHLLVNLQETLKRLFERHPRELHQAKQRYAELVTEKQPTVPSYRMVFTRRNHAQSSEYQRPAEAHRLKRFQPAKAFQSQGLSRGKLRSKSGSTAGRWGCILWSVCARILRWFSLDTRWNGSNTQTEGRVNRLKLVKQEMEGGPASSC